MYLFRFLLSLAAMRTRLLTCVSCKKVALRDHLSSGAVIFKTVYIGFPSSFRTSKLAFFLFCYRNTNYKAVSMPEKTNLTCTIQYISEGYYGVNVLSVLVCKHSLFKQRKKPFLNFAKLKLFSAERTAITTTKNRNSLFPLHYV